MKSSSKSSIFLITWMLGIWVLSSLPGDQIPKLDSINFDKLLHFGEYLIAGVLINYSYRVGILKRLSRHKILILFVLLTCLDEAHQAMIPNRTVSVLDLMADLAGLFSGFTISRYMSKNKYDRV